MAQDSFRHASKRPQDGPKTVSSALRALQGPPQEAQIFRKRKENQCFLPSRFFASDWLLRPQDGPKTAQESPKRGPRGPQDGPKSAQERPKSGPRGAQDALFEPPRGRWELRAPPLFEQWGQDGPKRRPRPPKRAPRGPQDAPKELQEGPRKALRGPQDRPKMAPRRHYESSKSPSPQHIPKA